MIGPIEVKQGKLNGQVKKSVLTEMEYYSFQGIPYAKPPINELRFQAPVPLEKWEGILDATKEGMPCIQKDYLKEPELHLIGSEDCLFLNVYTPKPLATAAALKPVMVFIHGGGFICGSGGCDLYSADYLINYDVVFVTFNYRLHAFGFLNLGTKNAVPNCGLRDQVEALRWIKENIRQFGGDPKNVTIFGESAGSSSVHHHLLSPLSRGLFHKAILQSGTINSPWSWIKNPEQNGLLLAKNLGYKDEEDPEKAVEFLKKQSAEQIVKNVTAMLDEIQPDAPGRKVLLGFQPSIEVFQEHAFMPEHPEKLAKSAIPVPIMVGLCDKEGRLAYRSQSKNLIESLRNDFNKFIKLDLNCDEKRLPAVCKSIKDFYFGEKEIGPDTLDSITDLFTDISFPNFYESFENFTKSKCPVYVYEFGFHGKFNFFTKLFMNNIAAPSFGAAHADDLCYLFFQPVFVGNKFEEPEVTVIDNMCRMWSNFAKTGNPTQGMKAEWKPSTNENPCYLRIDKELKLVEGKMTPERIEFWKKLGVLSTR